MKYESAQLRTSLAAEYALGTLRGRARARLEKLLGKDAAWREEVTFWNERLSDLALRLPPKAPRDVVWAALERELERDASLAQRKVVPLRSKPRDTVVPATIQAAPAANSPYWKIATLAAGIAAVALGAGLMRSREQNLELAQTLNSVRQEATVATQLAASASATVDRLSAQLSSIKPNEALPYVAVFAPAEGGTDMRWAVSLHPTKKVMRVLLTGSRPMPMTPGAKALELWIISKDGPQPLGMLPMSVTSTPHEMPLPAIPAEELGMAFTLAVSEEPEGGSPTGKPTGKVLGAFAAAKAI